MGSATTQATVLVIGSGISGLLVAQGLKKNGINCTVFEREPSAAHYRPREWGMSIQWGLPLLAHVLPKELFDRVKYASVDPNTIPDDPGRMPTFNGATGEHIKDIPLVRMYRVSRRKMRALCAEGINIRYGKQLRSISLDDAQNTVTAHFEDGTSETGTHLIGADGASSPTRDWLFHDTSDPSVSEAKTVPYSALNTHVCYKDVEKAKFVRQHHPIMCHAIHPNGYWLFIAVQDVPDPNDPATWIFQLQTTWHRKEGEVVTDLARHKKMAESFGEPFKSAFQWIPEGTTLYENRISYWIPVEWDNRNGRILLVGDAAHAMTFQRGQGMNHGIGDAIKLTNEFVQAKDGTKSWKEAADAYEAEMIDRAGDEVRTSLENTDALHDWNRFRGAALLTRGGDANRPQPPTQPS